MPSLVRNHRSRLHARPWPMARDPLPIGTTRIDLEGGRSAQILVTAPLDEPSAPLILALHGAGGDASHRIGPLRTVAERLGAIVVAVDSQGPTWDLILGGFDADVKRIDDALAFVFSHCAVDPERVMIEGFSDGASYALSLGLANGDLFQRLIAFAPGFMQPGPLVGRPPITIAHGRLDPVLPVTLSRERIVPKLRALDYTVTYREFTGVHAIPREIVDWAFSER